MYIYADGYQNRICAISGSVRRGVSRRDALFVKHVTVVRTANCQVLTRDASTEADKQASLFFLLSSSLLSTVVINHPTSICL